MSNLLILLPRIHPSFEIKFSKLIKISKHSFLCLSLLIFSYLVAYLYLSRLYLNLESKSLIKFLLNQFDHDLCFHQIYFLS